MAPKEFGVETTIDGVTIHTRYPWEMFDQKWRDEFVRCAKFHRDNPPAGWEFVKLFVDHINLKNETFQPRVDLRMVGRR